MRIDDAARVRELTRPSRLHVGDRVAIVAPSGPVREDRLSKGCAILRGWGLDVAVAPHVTAVDDRFRYLAGADRDRAADLHAAWLDPTVAGIVCARGGYGAERILGLLDWAAMGTAGPKVFAGFSDVTALHEAFGLRLGLATLHSPMAAAQVFVSDDLTAELFRRTLFEPESVQTITSPTAETLVSGTARGVTVGGCLSLLASAIGTPTGRQSVAGGILLLEDVAEEPYRLDRMLTHLLRSGWLDGVAGIVFGSLFGCGPADQLRALMLDRLGGLGVPIVWEFGFGHGPSSLTVPLGVLATLAADPDANASTLTLDVPALR
ncbi:MAG TPA: LD-carboxypeptidase [Jiangellaceae bacterium]|nr:LD-carboxypeptidase [Jiangellaceae bacterium]